MMKVLAGSFGVALALLGGCTTGSAGGGDDGGSDDSADELLCSAEMSLTGTFSESVLKPTTISGCWPIGTWTFTAAITSNDCSPAPTPPGNFTFTVSRDESAAEPDYTWVYSYPADPTAEVHVSSGGGGLCEAQLMIYSGDGKTMWNLHPALPDANSDGLVDGTVTGQGTYEVHTIDQRPEPAGE